MCVLCVIVCPEPWRVSITCVLGAPCVSVFDICIIHVHQQYPRAAAALSEPAAALVRHEELSGVEVERSTVSDPERQP